MTPGTTPSTMPGTAETHYTSAAGGDFTEPQTPLALPSPVARPEADCAVDFTAGVASAHAHALDKAVAATALPALASVSATSGADTVGTSDASGTAADATTPIVSLPAAASVAAATPIGGGSDAGHHVGGSRPPSVQAAAVVPAVGLADGGPRPAMLVEPVVPRSGQMFTAEDIDSIMDKLAGGSGRPLSGQFRHLETEGVVSAVSARGAGDPAGTAAAAQVTQNFGDISQDFFRSHHMDVQADAARQLDEHVPGPHKEPAAQALCREEVPQRRNLQNQIQAIDSWLEDDFVAREQLAKPGASSQMLGGSATAGLVADLAPAGLKAQLSVAAGGGHGAVAASCDPDGAETELFKKLEDLKRRKGLGEKAPAVALKGLAQMAKPLFPTMNLEKLVRALQLFTSARHEDHDLYLRILGEIPVQIRGISPEMLTTCVRVLWRLRLHEETYLELFTMEAMNMIRSARRPVARAPRRPPAPGSRIDAAATAAAHAGTFQRQAVDTYRECADAAGRQIAAPFPGDLPRAAVQGHTPPNSG